jgi:ankyrin repeat protein
VENGHFDIVRFFIDECDFCVNYYGLGPNGATPLYFATNSEEMSRLLLKNGANPDLAGTMGRSGSRAAEFGPLYLAVRGNNTAVARLLLVEYHANPNLNHKPEDDCRKSWCPRNTDLAIMHGNAEMLRMLLEHGALVRLRNFSDLSRDFGTYLNILLRNVEKSRETKLSICRLLVEHAAKAWEHNDASRTA